MAWVNEDGIIYNNENPMVRDECWARNFDSEFDEDDEDWTKPPKGYHNVNYKVDLYELDDAALALFKEEIKVIEALDYAPQIEFNPDETVMTITGVMNDDGEEDLEYICCDRYGLNIGEVW